MAIIKFLFALLVGFVAGTGTTVYLINSGAGDFVIRRTEVVQDLERRLREMEFERERLGRTLEDLSERESRMEAKFDELERRFRNVVGGRAGRGRGRPGAPGGSQPVPPAPRDAPAGSGTP